MSLKLEIVTPTGKVLDTVVNEVVAPGALGEFAVLPNHRPGIVLLGGGAIRFDGGVVFVRGGVAEISAERVLVLADEAVKAENAGTVNAAAILDKLAAETAAHEFVSDEQQQHFETERRYAEAILSAGR
jgi:F-type H+-transporting ATPase subunit epsilon